MTTTTTRTPMTGMKISTLREGKALSIRGNDYYVQCALRRSRYVVECGWAVMDGYDDDPGLHSYWPFRGPWREMSWVGCSITTDDTAEAAQQYEEYRTAIINKRGHTLEGEAIGSVVR